MTLPALDAATRASALAPMLASFDARVAEIKPESGLDRRGLKAFDRAVAKVDRAKVADLQRFIEDDQQRLVQLPAFKYLDLPGYLANKTRIVTTLDLDEGPKQRILDLGVGAGFFPFIAKCHGHSVLGIDMDNDVYAKILAVFGVERVTQLIIAGQPLEVTGPFDLITSIQTTFNRPVGRARRGRTSVYWTFEEWRWFMEQLSGLLAYPGRIFLHLNRQVDPETGVGEEVALLDMFGRNGAEVDHRRSTALFRLKTPLKLEP